MKKNFRSLALFTALVLLIAALTACSAPTPAAGSTTGSTTSGAGDVKTIHVLTMDQAAMSVDDMNAVAADFMAANPDIKVEMTYVPYEQVHDKFTTGMAANPPAYDVVMVDVVWYDEWIKAGYLADTTANVTAEMEQDIFPAAWNVVTRNGKSYGMPWLLDTKYLYYNMDMLQQAGFDAPPKTWEELTQMAQTIKDQGLAEYPIVWSWKTGRPRSATSRRCCMGMAASSSLPMASPPSTARKGSATLTWMKQTLDDGLSNPASVSDLEGDVLNSFTAGKAAFALNWLFMYDTAQFDEANSTVTGKVGITHIPVFEGTSVESASVDGSSGFSIAATSPNVDAAWKYVEYLNSEEVQMKYSSKQLPIWSTAYEGSNLDKLTAATRSNPVTVPAFQDQFQFAVLRPNIAYYNEGSLALQLALQEALTGAKTPQEALDEAAAKWTELAAK